MSQRELVDRTDVGSRFEFERPLVFQREHRGRKRLEAPPALSPTPVEAGNVPRIAKLLALAHRFERLVREGAVRDFADLARLGGVSRARVSQIMDLLLLAPEIQEEIFSLPRSIEGKDRITEKQIRVVVRQISWRAQLTPWRQLLAGDKSWFAATIQACPTANIRLATSESLVPTSRNQPVLRHSRRP